MSLGVILCREIILLIAPWTHQQIDPSDKVSILGNVISILAISFGERMQNKGPWVTAKSSYVLIPPLNPETGQLFYIFPGTVGPVLVTCIADRNLHQNLGLQPLQLARFAV